MNALAIFSAFGLHWRSDIELPGFEPALPGEHVGRAMVDIREVVRLPQRSGGQPVNRGVVYTDGIRVSWGQEVVFDMIGGERIDYCPGEAWTGRLPAFFYSTVVALTLAWRGLAPFHACAVEYDDQAILIAGAAGAGKSTLTAGLLSAGAYFVGDDLTAVERDSEGKIRVLPGRPTIRLHRDTASTVASSASAPVEGDPRGKWLVRPLRRSVADRLPLGTVLLLQDDALQPTGGIASDRLLAHIFRRRWMAALPMRAHVIGTALAISRSGAVLPYTSQGNFDASRQRSRVDDVLRLIRAQPDGSAAHALSKPGATPPHPRDGVPAEERTVAGRVSAVRA